MKKSIFSTHFFRCILLLHVFVLCGLNHTQAQGRVKAKALMITAGKSSDQEKAMALAQWICKHLKYDLKRYLKCSPERYSNKKILRRRKAVCDEYSNLYREMCESVGIKAYVVDGYTKDLFFDVHDRYYRVDHAWNALVLDEKWYLADLTFASGYITFKPRKLLNTLRKIVFLPPKPYKIIFKHRYNEDYIFNTPEKFLFNHIPADPAWAMVPVPAIMQVESDSQFYYQRENPGNKNLHDETGRPCPDCLEKYSLTPYESRLDKAKETYAYNNREEEFVMEGHCARGDSMYHYIQRETREKRYSEENIDSLGKAFEHYNNAIKVLRSHTKNIRVDYKNKTGKEKSKLTHLKKVTGHLRMLLSRSRSRLKSWKKQAHDRAGVVLKNMHEKNFGLRLPDRLPENKFNTSDEEVFAQFAACDVLQQHLKDNWALNEQTLRMQHNMLQCASHLSADIVLCDDSLLINRLTYHDDWKKPVVELNKKYLPGLLLQQTIAYDSLGLNMAQFNRQMRSGDSLLKAYFMAARANYISARQMEGFRPHASDSLIKKVFADFENIHAAYTAHALQLAELLRTSEKLSAQLARTMDKEKKRVNVQLRVERLRARAFIKHFTNDRDSRFVTGKRVQASIYAQRRHVRKLQQNIRKKLKKEKIKT